MAINMNDPIEEKDDFGYTMPEPGTYLVNLENIEWIKKERGDVARLTFTIIGEDAESQSQKGLTFSLFFSLYTDTDNLFPFKQLSSILRNTGLPQLKQKFTPAVFCDGNKQNSISLIIGKNEATMVLKIDVKKTSMGAEMVNLVKVMPKSKWSEVSKQSRTATPTVQLESLQEDKAFEL